MFNPLLGAKLHTNQVWEAQTASASGSTQPPFHSRKAFPSTFLCAVSTPAIIILWSQILCLHDCATYPSPGLHNFSAQLSGCYFPSNSTPVHFSEVKGVVLGPDMSRQPRNMKGGPALQSMHFSTLSCFLNKCYCELKPK